MSAQMFLYRPNLVQNPKFAEVNNYGWTLAIGFTFGPADPNNFDYPFVKVNGSISTVANVQGKCMYQYGICRANVKYRLKYTVGNWTAGILKVQTATLVLDPGTFDDNIFSHPSKSQPTIGANGTYDETFISDGNTLLFSMANTFDGTIYNVSLIEYPEVYELDVEDNVNVPLNFNIDTILKLDQRKTNFSKSIKLKGTQANNKAFNHIYKINSASLFNPNLKSNVVIKNGGVTVFEGVLCLDEVTEKLINNIQEVEYTVTVYGESLNIFDRLGNRTIKDLDFSRYDHPFSIEAIEISWRNIIYDNGGFGTNRTFNYASTITSITSVTFFDNVVNFSNGFYVKINFAAPHSFSVNENIYIDSSLYQIFGDTIVLDVPSSTSITIGIKKFWVGAAPACTGSVKSFLYDGIGYWYPMVDNGKYQTNLTGAVDVTTWEISGGLLTIGQRYIIKDYHAGDDFTNVGGSNATGIDFIASGTTPNNWAMGSVFLTTRPCLKSGRSYTIDFVVSPDDFTNVGAPNNNGGTTFVATGTTPNSFIGNVGSLIKTNLFTTDTTMKNLERHDAFISVWEATDFIPHIFVSEILVKMQAILGIVFDCSLLGTEFINRIVMPCDSKFDLKDFQISGTLVTGRKYYIHYYNAGDDFTNIGATSNATGVIFIATGSTPTVWTNGTGISMMCEMNQWLPGMKLSDFFKSFLNMFNLAIVGDVDNTKVIKLINRSEFFTNTVIDWTDKVSADDILKITLSNKILPQYYHLKYKDSSDFYNVDYNNDFGNVNNNYGSPNIIDRKYGDNLILNNAEFATTTNIIETTFESTVMAGPIQPVTYLGTLISDGIYAGSDKTLSPCFYGNVDGTQIKRTSANRLLLIGIFGTANKWSLNAEDAGGYSRPDVTMGAASTRFYPWAGHTDPHNSHCILFGRPFGNYSPIATPEKKTLYSKYWKRYVEEINHVNGRIIECTLKLSITDIAALDFTKLYRIDDFVMKLNKVIDYNVNGDGVCKVEFLLKNT